MAGLRSDLARYFFGKRAKEATWADVAAAQGLKETIHPSLGNISLDDACTTLPPVLANSTMYLLNDYGANGEDFFGIGYRRYF